MPIKPGSADALIVVDMQNDFMPGGSLAVAHGDDLIPLLNRLLPCFATRVLTRDWHPPTHVSFSSKPEFKDLSWPAHCVQNTPGARFHPKLKAALADKIVSKGDQAEKEAYSGFQNTDLESWLKERGIRRVFVGGVATDYCVKNTALDAVRLGFATSLLKDAIRAVDVPPGTGDAAIEELAEAGVHILSAGELACP